MVWCLYRYLVHGYWVPARVADPELFGRIRLRNLPRHLTGSKIDRSAMSAQSKREQSLRTRDQLVPELCWRLVWSRDTDLSFIQSSIILNRIWRIFFYSSIQIQNKPFRINSCRFLRTGPAGIRTLPSPQQKYNFKTKPSTVCRSQIYSK